jgi:ribonuclease R
MNKHVRKGDIIESLSKRILDFLARYPNELFKSKELARRLTIRNEKEYDLFKKELRLLQDSGEIRRVRGKKFGHMFIPSYVEGILQLTKQGFGFVRAEADQEDIFIGPRLIGNASDGDRVKVVLFAESVEKKRNERREGEVIEVLQRSRTTIVGTLEKSRRLYVVSDDNRNGKDVSVAKDDLNGAEEGDKVVVAIDSWGTGHQNPEGRIIEVLGKAGEVSAEILSVAREFKLPLSFPQDVLQECERIPVEIPGSEIQRRLDIRDRVCFTIDPYDAKDFDDAVSLDARGDGDYILGVHIADVSYYVRENTALDTEALSRGTSVYFPNGVIPMLPEKLSNNICSLRPNEDRMTYSVFITVTPKGVVKDYAIRETVICSKRRFTYEEVQAIVESKTGGHKGDYPDIVREMFQLSSVLTKKRMKEGSIDFESAEAKFEFDESGKPLRIVKKVRLESHRLVEEFMLLANKVVAQHIGLARKEGHQKPFLYRIHDSPDPEKISELSLFVEKFGYKLRVDGGVTTKALQKLLQDVKGTEVEDVINEVALRAMAKAIYSDRNIGHYGLAFDYYSHFTSPIRRYPDMVIHRLLKEYETKISMERRETLRKRMPSIAKQSSEMERKAMEAERAAVKVMQVEYMKRHVGDEFHAVISGVTHFGIFVEVNELLVEGMIHVRDLEDDYYVHDEKRFALVGRRSGKQYRLGDSVYVKVVRVNPEERQIDFAIAKPEGEIPRSK